MFGTKILGMILVIFSVRDVLSRSFMSTEGPYKIVVSNISRCAPSPDWFQWNLTTFTTKGRSLLRGTINMSRNIPEMKFSVHMYYLEETKTKVFDMKNQNCHNTIIEIVLKSIGLPFNTRNCRVKAGSYEFTDLNLDAIVHSVVQSLWYGPSQVRFEMYMRGVMLGCVDIYIQVVKL